MEFILTIIAGGFFVWRITKLEADLKQLRLVFQQVKAQNDRDISRLQNQIQKDG